MTLIVVATKAVVADSSTIVFRESATAKTAQEPAVDESAGRIRATLGEDASGTVHRFALPAVDDAPKDTRFGRVVVPMAIERWNTGVLWPSHEPALPVAQERCPRTAFAPAEPPALVYSSTAPQVQVSATGPSQVTVGQPAQYTVTVDNGAVTAARGVVVTVTLAAEVEVADLATDAGDVSHERADQQRRAVVWVIDQLDADARAALAITIRPTSAEPVAMDVAWTMSPRSQALQIATLRPELELEFTGPDTAIAGDSTTFAVEVANPGSADAHDVVVELATMAGQSETVPLGTLAAGEARRFQIEVTDLPAGLTELAATVWARDGLRQEALQSITVSQATLVVEALGPPAKSAGSEAAYIVRVENTGSAAAEDVLLTAALPDGVAATNLPKGATHLGGRVTWPAGTLLPGEAREFRLGCTVNSAGAQVLRFSAADRRHNEAAARLETVVRATADVRMVVDAGPTEMAVGDDMTYVVTLHNHGNSAATNVQVGMQLDHNLHVVEVRGAEAEQMAGNVNFAPLPQLKPGEPHVLEVVARGRQPGYCSYRVDAVSAEGDVRLAHEGGNLLVPSNRKPPHIAMHVQLADTQTVAGSEIVYEIELTNQSNHVAEDVEVTLRLDPQIVPLAVDGAPARIAGNVVTFQPLPYVTSDTPQTLRVTARADRPGLHAYRAELTTSDQRMRVAQEGIVRVLQRQTAEQVRSIAIRPTDAKVR